MQNNIEIKATLSQNQNISAVLNQIQSMGADVIERGATGNGIASIVKTGTSGLVDTYTINYTNGTTSTFTVTNGATGNGITDISKTSTSGFVDTYTITYSDGDTTTFEVTNGKDGADGAAATITVGTVTTGAAGSPASVINSGTSSAAVLDFTIPQGAKGDTGNTGATGNGVLNTEYISSAGLVDTYHINYTNGNYDTFTVTNGQDGAGSVSDVLVNGTSVLDGSDAKILIKTINSNSITGSGNLDVGTVTSVNNVSPVSGNVTLSIPTDTSDLTNNAGFITSSALSGYATETWVGNQGYLTGITSGDVTTALGYTPQEELVSGTNIKTINNESLLGSGNIDIQSGGAEYGAINPIEISQLILGGSKGYEFSSTQAYPYGDTPWMFISPTYGDRYIYAVNQNYNQVTLTSLDQIFGDTAYMRYIDIPINPDEMKAATTNYPIQVQLKCSGNPDGVTAFIGKLDTNGSFTPVAYARISDGGSNAHGQWGYGTFTFASNRMTTSAGGWVYSRSSSSVQASVIFNLNYNSSTQLVEFGMNVYTGAYNYNTSNQSIGGKSVLDDVNTIRVWLPSVVSINDSGTYISYNNVTSAWSVLNGATSTDFIQLNYNTTSLGLDINNKLEVIGKANTDFSNITINATDEIAGDATISPEYDVLTVGANGSTYTSPAHGYFRLHGGSSTNAFARLTNTTTGMWLQDQIINAYGNLSILLPVYEGESITLNYDGTNSLALEFYYAVGTQWKQT